MRTANWFATAGRPGHAGRPGQAPPGGPAVQPGPGGQGGQVGQGGQGGSAGGARLDPAPPGRPAEQEIHDANARFVAHVVSWHRVVPLAGGTPSAMCACGAYAAMCAYLRAAHDILGHPVPWDGSDPPDPYRGA